MTHPTLPEGYRVTAHQGSINETLFYIWKGGQEVGWYKFLINKGWVTNTRNTFDYPQDARDFLVGRFERMNRMNEAIAQSLIENPVLAR